GFRPLVKPKAERGTASITRDHHIEVSASGMVTITGGKWTTYRHMAADAVNQAVASADLQPQGPSRTDSLPLSGAKGYTPQLARQLSADYGIDEDSAAHLAGAYGGNAKSLLELGKSLNLLGRLHPDYP